MHKSQRLFQLLNILRGRRTAITATSLAQVLEVSKRTIYRDIDDLIASGMPISGEAGVGYLLAPDFDLPPLMFTAEEMQALLLGAQMVGIWTDPALAQGAMSAQHKIRAVLPQQLLNQADNLPYIVPAGANHYHDKEQHGLIRRAYEQQQKLALHYRDAKQQLSRRLVWPLAMVFWGGVWTLLAWCEKRQAYRNFRFDRIQQLELSSAHFDTSEAINLAHYLREQINKKPS